MAYTDICGSKLRSKLGAALNESATSHSPALLTSNQSFAKRQLEKMGWTEGTGLGKRRDGLVDHVKIRQRDDEMGLGREKMLAKEVADVWWKESVGGTLAKLQKKKSLEKEKKKKKKKDEKLEGNEGGIKFFTDEELFEATGGARFGMRAQRRAEGKWKRTESGSLLMDLEEKARANMEWNGRGKAQVALTTGNSTSQTDASVGEAVKSKRKEENSDASKKKRKNRDEVEPLASCIHAVSPPISEEEGDDMREERSQKKKRRKRDKEEKQRIKSQEISPPGSDEAKSNTDDKKKKKKKDKKQKKSSKK